MSTAAPATVWLPALQRFDPTHALYRLLQRADRLPDASPGRVAMLGEAFAWDADASTPLPAAALLRQFHAGDAGDGLWLQADPAWVQPELNGARLLACGQLALGMDEAHSLVEALAPAFEDAGLILQATTADHWHLRLPPGSVLPGFDPPEQVLGDDLLQHLPEGPHARRWQRLLNDVQVLLHQHPLQVQRRARGLAPVNSVWLWGAGELPRQVRTQVSGVVGEDALLLALAVRAGIETAPLAAGDPGAFAPGRLVDLQQLPVETIDAQWQAALLAALRRQPVALCFASGERWLSRPWHRLRLWRRGA